MPFQFKRLAIPDVILIEAPNLRDERGFFRETYKFSEFAANGIALPFVQDNHSRSMRGVLRGLHYQKNPRAQGKLVRVVHGEIFDVAVDIRQHSPTFRKWIGITLSADENQMLYIPPGFAHGLCVLSDEADVIYKVTAEYAPELDRGIIWNDPDLAIEWPLVHPILSPKDAGLPRLRDSDNDFE